MILLLLATVCLLAAAFFSMAEMAFIAADRLRLRHLAEEGRSPTAARYLAAFHQPERALSAAMMGVTIAHVVAASAITSSLLPILGHLRTWLVVTVGLTAVMLVFGEIIPKAIAREWATELILVLYRPLASVAALLAPLVAFANAVIRWALRRSGLPPPDARTVVSREELKALLQLEPGEAAVSSQEAQIEDLVDHLGDTTVREIMVPLVDVVMLPDTATPAEAIAVVRQRGFSRLPVFRRRETDVVGVVTAMDILSRGAEVSTLDQLMRPPYYVPETKRIDDLLRELQRARSHLAVVVDEYGGSTGVVTLEDVLEEIVGEIQDEHDRTPAAVERLPDGSYWVAARSRIEELNEGLGWTLPKADFETVAGLVLATLHRIPRTGEEIQVPGYTVTVLEADGRHVGAVKIAPVGTTER